MHIDTYSPFLKNFGATEYDIRQDGSQPKPRYNGSEDNLTLPVDLTTRKTSFSTDSLAAYVPSGTIGTDEVTSNGVATTTWDKLLPGTSYGWIVSAKSADGGEAVAQPAVFGTAAGPDDDRHRRPDRLGHRGDGDRAGRGRQHAGHRRRGVARGYDSSWFGHCHQRGRDVHPPGGPRGRPAPADRVLPGQRPPHPVEATATLTVNLPAEWNPSTVYNDGDRATYQGRVFRASWYTKNQKPGADPNGAWQEIAMTEDGTAIWTASRIFNSGDLALHDGRKWRAQWYTRNQKPGDRNGPWEEIAPTRRTTARRPGRSPRSTTPATGCPSRATSTRRSGGRAARNRLTGTAPGS
ncbi:carbohydrate-binding protein [Micromonospora sp. M12]